MRGLLLSAIVLAAACAIPSQAPLLPTAAGQILPAGLPAGSNTEQALAERISKGMGLQFLVRPEPGRLLDPTSTKVSLNGTPIESFLYYTTADLALILTLPPPMASGELKVEAAYFDNGGAFGARFVLPLAPEADPAARRQWPLVLVLDESNEPLSTARLFGQRHADLFAAADSNGRIPLTAPTRTTPEPHVIWAPGTWTEHVDPRTSPRLRLIDAPAGLRGWMSAPGAAPPPGLPPPDAQLRFVWKDSGLPVGGVLAGIDDMWWAITDADGSTPLWFPPHRDELRIVPIYGDAAPGRQIIARPGAASGILTIELERRPR